MSSSLQPFSDSANRNKGVIAEQLKLHLVGPSRLLEVASGTGQHAIHMTEQFPHVVWQPSDMDVDAMGLRAFLLENKRSNLLDPMVLDIRHWPNLRPAYDALFSANCLHVAPKELAPLYMRGGSKSLKRGGKLMLYGPFKYGGKFTSESNERFNDYLGGRYEGAGIRDFEWLNELAAENDLKFESDQAMPANNQFIVWQKI